MKNEYLVTRKMYVGWALENMLQTKKRIAVLIAVVISAVMVAFGLSGGGQPLLILFACMFFYMAVLRDLHMAFKKFGRLCKKSGTKKLLRTVELGEDHIAVSEGEASAELPYASVQDVWEKKNKILLVFEGSTVVRLYRDAFVDCTWEQCREFLEQQRSRTPALPEEPEE